MPDENTRLSILQLINQVATDENYMNKVSVLPLMCGTGKSTAVRHKIKEVIENLKADGSGDGIIVVTDTIAGLHAYLSPENDEELKQFFETHKDKICLVTAADAKEKLKTQKSCPVLMLSTQRFFSSKRETIEYWLAWKKGKRSLIIIDELPYLIESQNLNRPLLSHLEDELLLCIFQDSKANQRIILEDDTDSRLKHQMRFLIDTLQKISIYYFDLKGTNETLYCYFACDSNYDLVKYYIETEEEFVPLSVEKWSEGTPQDVIDMYNCTMPLDIREYKALFSIEKLIFKYNDYLSRNTKRLFHAWNILMTKGTLAGYARSNTGYSLDDYIVTWNNKSLLEGLPSKVIVLDGTGDVFPDYKQEYIQHHDCSAYRRRLPLLTVNIIHYESTSKTSLNSMSNKQLESVFREIIQYIRGKHPDIEGYIPIFSFKDIEEFYKKIGNGNEEIESAHFGAIKGRNDFADKSVIVQVGIFLQPESYYLARYLELHPEIVEAEDFKKELLEFQEHEMKTIQETKQMYKNILHSEAFLDYKTSCLLTDLEQNIFRTSIRNPSSNIPVTYYLFADVKNFGVVIHRLRSRFHDYGAHVEVIERTPVELTAQKVLNRNNEKKGEDSKRAICLRYILSLPEGTEYTKKQICDYLESIEKNSVKKNTFKKISEPPVIAAVLSADYQEGRRLNKPKGVYVRKK